MLPDLPGTLLAIVMLALVGLAPGWGVAYWLDLLSFRSRFITYKIAIAMAASLAVCPIVLVAIVRYTNLRAGACVMIALDLLALGAVVHAMRVQRRHAIRSARTRRTLISFTAIAAIVWMIVALIWLLDFVIGDRLHMSVPWADHTKRVGWIDAIVRTGVPPDDPSTHPGRPIKMFYYYGWYVWAAAGQMLGGRAINPLHVLVAGVVWTGWAMIGSLALALQYLGGVTRRNLRRGWIVATLLLTVTGLDVGPGIVRLVRTLGDNDVSGAPRTGEWWNEQVTGFVDMMLWVPHHVSAMVIGIVALALWLTRARAPRLTIIMMGVALASLATVSLYVALPLGFFLIGCAIVALKDGRSRDTLALVLAAVIALVLAAQYLYDLISAPGAPGASAGIALNVRAFSPISMGLLSRGVSPAIVYVVNFLLLPVNYLFEFGFFLVAGIVYWLWRRGERRPIDRFACGLFWASLLTATFLRSSIAANDLGWRSIMFAQIVLLVWSIQPAIAMWDGVRGVEQISRASESLLEHFSRTISVLFLMCVIGISSTLHDLFLLRFSFSIWPEVNVQPQRSLELRRAYVWINQNTPADAIIQHNIFFYIDLFASHYAHRQLVAADRQSFGAKVGDEASHKKMNNAIYEHFSLRNPPRDVGEFFAKYNVHALVVQDTDANWPRKDSWFWTTPAVYENGRARVILVKDLLNAPSTVPAH